MTAARPRRAGEREGTGYWDGKPGEPFLMTMRRGHTSAKPQGAQTSMYRNVSPNRNQNLHYPIYDRFVHRPSKPVDHYTTFRFWA